MREYFDVKRKECRGMVVVFAIFMFIYLFPYAYQKFYLQPQTLQIQVETFAPQIKEIEKATKKHPYFSSEMEPSFNPYAEVDLFKFNPNNLPLDNWMKLGLSKKQAQIIKKYESKGGKFYKKEDLKKIYSISEKQYQKLLPYIDIPKTNYPDKFKEENVFEKPVYKKIIVDINAADSSELTTIKGIGPSFASRIIKYRTRLGGFINKNQLQEVYGIDSIKFNQIKDQVNIDVENIRTIAINSVTFDELKNMPYLKYKQSSAIIAYRNQHGAFKNIADLRKILLLNQEIIDKIAPYLKFDD